MKSAQSVDAADIAIDSVTFPLTQYVSMFDVEPPGAQPHRIAPIATSGLSLKACESAKIMSGMKPNCDSIPTPNARFLFRQTSRTCSGWVVAPRPNATHA